MQWNVLADYIEKQNRFVSVLIMYNPQYPSLVTKGSGEVKMWNPNTLALSKNFEAKLERIWKTLPQSLRGECFLIFKGCCIDWLILSPQFL